MAQSTPQAIPRKYTKDTYEEYHKPKMLCKWLGADLKKKRKANELEDVACDRCRSTDNRDDHIMLCSTCGNGRHLLCSELKSVPEGEWYCSKFCELGNVRF